MEKKMNFVGLGGAAAVVIGVFLPYVSAMGMSFSLWSLMSMPMVGGGFTLRVALFLIAAVGSGVLFFMQQSWGHYAIMGLSGLALALFGYDFSQGMSAAGMGMYIIGAGLAAIMSGAVMDMKAAKEDN